MFFWWQYSTADTSCANGPRASASDIGPCWSRKQNRSPPPRYSITRNRALLVWITSNSLMMLGWSSSFRQSASRCCSLRCADVLCQRTTLMATFVSVATCRASTTLA